MSQTKQKILFLITKGNWGGAQRYVFDLACALSKRNYEVLVGHGTGKELALKLEAEKISTISIHGLDRNINLLEEIKTFFKIIKILQNTNPEVLHINSPKIGGLGALAGRIMGVKRIIYTAHGWPFNENRGWLSRMIIKKLSWLTIVLSHQTIVIAERERQNVLNWPFVKNKITLIHNGVKNDSSRFLERENAQEFIIHKTKLPPSGKEAIWIGTIAELHKNKGLEYGIEAIKKLSYENPESNFIWIIIGSGEERTKLDTQITESNLNSSIYLTGYVDSASDYLKAFDIFVLPSIKEGLPYVLLEAGAAELAVIASDVGGIGDIIEEGKTGVLVPAKNPDALKTALKELLGDLRKRQGLANNLKDRVNSEFCEKTMVEKTIRIYEKEDKL